MKFHQVGLFSAFSGRLKAIRSFKMAIPHAHTHAFTHGMVMRIPHAPIRLHVSFCSQKMVSQWVTSGIHHVAEREKNTPGPMACLSNWCGNESEPRGRGVLLPLCSVLSLSLPWLT
ncbi:hypothetical protein V6N13_093762 [Hibiscus sabdariffa]|uniref:Uncharacterized protein n=1 Tax=Hibiscus sabdariffa TaxID=183260 RepID=A0ABR2BS12_9ROSI